MTTAKTKKEKKARLVLTHKIPTNISTFLFHYSSSHTLLLLLFIPTTPKPTNPKPGAAETRTNKKDGNKTNFV